MNCIALTNLMGWWPMLRIILQSVTMDGRAIHFRQCEADADADSARASGEGCDALHYNPTMPEFVSRAGHKLEHALHHFQIDVTGCMCADLGCNAGGFVDCLLQRGASKVYAIDTGYGALDWKLRKDPRVVVMERTNAMHARLPEKVARITIDVAWTKQKHILPAARLMIADDGIVIALIKPHYEAEASLLRKGILPVELVESVVNLAVHDARTAGFDVVRTIQSPITGAGGNIEFLAQLRPVV